ncbi:MAG: hypothetical protein GY856_11140 [bacterium]|nr:hypothetical protein [bacterium]
MRATAKKSSSTLAGEISPDDLLIVQKRQDWRLRVATICVEFFDSCDKGMFTVDPSISERARETIAEFSKISDYLKKNLQLLLITGITVNDLEAVRYQVNYFLEEIIRYVRNNVQGRKETRSPLECLLPEEVEAEVISALRQSPDSLLVYIEDIIRLAALEIEVSRQRERIRLLLGGDRRLARLGNNEAIMRAELDRLWKIVDDFITAYEFIKHHLPPLLHKASPFPELEEELKVADEHLQGLVKIRIDPFEREYSAVRLHDATLRDLAGALREISQRATGILKVRIGSLRRQLSNARGNAVDASEIRLLSAELRSLGELFGKIPATCTIPAPEMPLTARGEDPGWDTSHLNAALEKLGADRSAIMGNALAAGTDHDASAQEEQTPALPDPSRLQDLLSETHERLTVTQERLASAVKLIEGLRSDRSKLLREDFCSIMGEFRTFLQTGFAHIAAKDPRSTESSYQYFLREFSNEAHQAIILLKEIRELEVFIGSLRQFQIAGLPLTPENLARILRVLFFDKDEDKRRIPSGEGWKILSAFLERLKTDLVPRLHRVCSLDGIRFDDRNHLSAWATELTENCTRCIAQHEIGYSLIQEMGRIREDPDQAGIQKIHSHLVIARTCDDMQKSLHAICMTLTDSIPYVGIMKTGIERRASIFFHRQRQVLRPEVEAATAPAPSAPLEL